MLTEARKKAILGFGGFGVTLLSSQQFCTVMKLLDSLNTDTALENVSKVAPNPELFGI